VRLLELEPAPSEGGQAGDDPQDDHG
jgi:hypothetical protein